jgi:hypothetical protein
MNWQLIQRIFPHICQGEPCAICRWVLVRYAERFADAAQKGWPR